MKYGFHRLVSTSDKSRKWLIWKRFFYFGQRRLRVLINLTFWRRLGHPIFEVQKHA